MSLGTHQEAFSIHLAMLILRANDLGYKVRMGEVYRTPEQQQFYVQTGRSKTMNSMHLKKCAADLHFIKGGELQYPEELGRFWESLDPLNQAGMFWKTFVDAPHFQRTVK